jgi:hypothetical protein
MTPKSVGRSRSLLALGLAALVGIGVGLAGTLLRTAFSPAASPEVIVVQGEAQDPQAVLERIRRGLLERLVLRSAQTDRPEQLSDFTDILQLFKRQPQRSGEILERLTAGDVPPALRLAFAKRVPSRPTGQRALSYRRLVFPLLSDPDPTVRLAAVNALAAAGQVLSKPSPACRCRFGHYPGEQTDDETTLLAWTLDEDSALSWSPTKLPLSPGGWDLRLQRPGPGEPGGKVLFQQLQTGPEPGQIIAANGLSGPRLVVPSAD